jgi:gliding motility-associated lipoprotein GldH
MRNRIIIALVSVLFLSACQEQPYFQQSFSFKNNTWARKNSPSFKVEIKDTSKAYNFVLTLRNSTNYAYNNVWVYLNSKSPDKAYAREPFEIKITDEKGRWLGKKTGSIVENRLVFRNRKLAKPGIYTFVFEQGITKKVLYNVLDLGLEIEEVKQ